MKNDDIYAVAMKNMAGLHENPYTGRGIVVGTSQEGHIAQIYWIMGRSYNSRNRVFCSEGGQLFTDAADPSTMEDPSLIIYNAMSQFANNFVVSNGNQTDTVTKALWLKPETTLRESLRRCKYEPDKPHFTPRITGLCVISLGKCLTQLSSLRYVETVEEKGPRLYCERSYWEYENITPGFGFCITTYSGDGNPLPSFKGEPYLLPIDGNITNVASNFWSVLNPENRVSLAVKFINRHTKEVKIEIINKYIKVEKEVV